MKQDSDRIRGNESGARARDFSSRSYGAAREFEAEPISGFPPAVRGGLAFAGTEITARLGAPGARVF